MSYMPRKASRATGPGMGGTVSGTPALDRKLKGGNAKTLYEKKEPRPKRFPRLDLTIGARNPYALAERVNLLLNNEPIKWDPTDFAKNRKIMGKLLNCTYSKLFDPLYRKSPLFPFPLTIKKLKPNTVVWDFGSYYDNRRISVDRDHLSGSIPNYELEKPGDLIIENSKDPILENPKGLILKNSRGPIPLLYSSAPSRVFILAPPGDHQNQGGGQFPRGDPVKVGATPCSDASADHWVKPAATYLYFKGGNPLTQRDVINDPVQGCTKNCYFLAALTSQAWVEYPSRTCPPFIAGIRPGESFSLANEYEFTFYPTPLTSEKVKVGACVVVDKNGTMVYSRPSSPEKEIWHALMEKAYHWKFSNPGDSTLPCYERDTYPHPNLGAVPEGHPLDSLYHLTGKSGDPILVKELEGDYIPGKTASCIEKIGAKINWNETTHHGMTKYPMVAWTYYDSTEANNEHKDYKIGYANEIIVANHAYSILGMINNKDAPGGDGFHYVVLRNPYGRLSVGGLDPDLLKDYLFTGIWNPTGFSLDLSVPDGIFALRVNQFVLYFKGFGWVE